MLSNSTGESSKHASKQSTTKKAEPKTWEAKLHALNSPTPFVRGWKICKYKYVMM